MDNKKIFCTNCNKFGHNSKKCLCAIISYGIICIKINIDNFDINTIINYTKKIQNNYLFSHDEIIKLKKYKQIINNIDNFDNIIQYLLIRRKNSINYVEFIRGKYDITCIDYIIKSINFLTISEKELIKNTSFDILWNNLWCNNIQNNNEFIEANEKFNMLKKGFYITKNDIKLFVKFDNLIKDSIYNFYEPEWGFPKGRRSYNEKNIDCAKREFIEETSIKENNFNIINMMPYDETYIASNSFKYKHIYYISQIKDINTELKIDESNLNQKIEISDIKWLSFKDGFDIIRNYNIEKKNILLNLHFNLKYILNNFIDILNIYLHKNS